jgi:hypothetical protein
MEWRVVGGLMFQSKRELCSGEIRGGQGKRAASHALNNNAKAVKYVYHL